MSIQNDDLSRKLSDNTEFVEALLPLLSEMHASDKRKLMAILDSAFGSSFNKPSAHFLKATPSAVGTQSLPYTQQFTTGFGTYETRDVSGLQRWTISEGAAKMSGFASSANHENEDWLVSSPVSLEAAQDVKVVVEANCKDFLDLNNELTIQVSTEYTPEVENLDDIFWQKVPIKWPESSDDSMASVEASLNSFTGQTIVLAVKYTSTEDKSGTARIASISIKEGKPEEGGGGGGGGGGSAGTSNSPSYNHLLMMLDMLQAAIQAAIMAYELFKLASIEVGEAASQETVIDAEVAKEAATEAIVIEQAYAAEQSAACATDVTGATGILEAIRGRIDNSISRAKEFLLQVAAFILLYVMTKAWQAMLLAIPPVPFLPIIAPWLLMASAKIISKIKGKVTAGLCHYFKSAPDAAWYVPAPPAPALEAVSAVVPWAGPAVAGASLLPDIDTSVDTVVNVTPDTVEEPVKSPSPKAVTKVILDKPSFKYLDQGKVPLGDTSNEAYHSEHRRGGAFPKFVIPMQTPGCNKVWDKVELQATLSGVAGSYTDPVTGITLPSKGVKVKYLLYTDNSPKNCYQARVLRNGVLTGVTYLSNKVLGKDELRTELISKSILADGDAVLSLDSTIHTFSERLRNSFCGRDVGVKLSNTSMAVNDLPRKVTKYMLKDLAEYLVDHDGSDLIPCQEIICSRRLVKSSFIVDVSSEGNAIWSDLSLDTLGRVNIEKSKFATLDELRKFVEENCVIADGKVTYLVPTDWMMADNGKLEWTYLRYNSDNSPEIRDGTFAWCAIEPAEWI